jgi:hypothetical protein
MYLQKQTVEFEPREAAINPEGKENFSCLTGSISSAALSTYSAGKTTHVSNLHGYNRAKAKYLQSEIRFYRWDF